MVQTPVHCALRSKAAGVPVGCFASHAHPNEPARCTFCDRVMLPPRAEALIVRPLEALAARLTLLRATRRKLLAREPLTDAETALLAEVLDEAARERA